MNDDRLVLIYQIAELLVSNNDYKDNGLLLMQLEILKQCLVYVSKGHEIEAIELASGLPIRTNEELEDIDVSFVKKIKIYN